MYKTFLLFKDIFSKKKDISVLMANTRTIEYLAMTGARIIFPVKRTWIFLFMTDTRTILLMTDKETLTPMTGTISLFMTGKDISVHDGNKGTSVHDTKKDISFHDRYNNYMNASWILNLLNTDGKQKV
jgi:hypothetical protein